MLETFAASTTGFIASRAQARGMCQAGVKTVHYCAPLFGFGNTIDPATGEISTNPALLWTYTKKEVTTAWTYSLGGFFDSPASLNTQQAAVNPGYSIGQTTNEGYTLVDFSDIPWPTPPAAVSSSADWTTDQQYFPWYDLTGAAGATLIQHNTNSTTGTPASPPFNFADAVYGAWTASPTTKTYFGGASVNLTNTLNGPAITVSGGTVTQSFSANLWSYVSYTTSVGYLSIGEIDTFFNEQATETIVTTYSEPVAMTDLEANAAAALAQIDLADENQQYYLFDAATVPVLINWSPIIGVNYPDLYTVWRAEYSGGTLGSYTRLASVYAGPGSLGCLDATAQPGQTYYYQVRQGAGSSAPAIITPGAISPPYFEVPAAYSPAPATGPAPTGVVAVQLGISLPWTTMANAEAPNQQIVLYPVDGTGDFVISNQVTCGTPLPFYLAGRGMPCNQTPLALADGIANSFVWSKSRGYLPGNSPAHSPPATGINGKYYYTQAGYLGAATTDVTASFPPLLFTCGRGGAYPWTLTRELPSTEPAFTYTDCPNYGYLFYN